MISLACLSGCDTPPEADAPSPSASRRTESCETVAMQRAKDAEYIGYDSKMKKAIYDRAYSDCVEFREHHHL